MKSIVEIRISGLRNYFKQTTGEPSGKVFCDRRLTFLLVTSYFLLVTHCFSTRYFLLVTRYFLHVARYFLLVTFLFVYSLLFYSLLFYSLILSITYHTFQFCKTLNISVLIFVPSGQLAYLP